MALKALIRSLDEVEENIRSLYTKVSDTEFVLDIDDKEYKNTISDFRDNNIQMSEKIKEFEKNNEKFKDIDPEKYAAGQAALEEMQKIKDKQLIDDGKIEELLLERTERLRADYQGQIDALTKDNEKHQKLATKYSGLYSQQAIDGTVVKTLSELKAEINPGAMQDILARARGTWTVDDDTGDLVPMKNGTVLYGKDPKVQLTMEEWGTELVNDAPWLFKQSAGGGAGGSGQQQLGSGSVIDKGDQDALNANLENIAAGKVAVAGE